MPDSSSTSTTSTTTATVNVKRTTSSNNNNNNNNRFGFRLRHTRCEFLDAYRGSLVLVSLFARLHNRHDSNIVNIAHSYEFTYSLCGFYSLSSLLLTYGLLVDLHTPATRSSLLHSFLQLLKYFIRRLVRVYVPYSLAYALFLIIITPSTNKTPNTNNTTQSIDYNPNWLGVVAGLEPPGRNLFWPIYTAIRYSILFVPQICILARLVGSRISMLFFSASLIWSLYEFLLNDTPAQLFDSPYVDFPASFSALFAGSHAGLALFLIERNNTLSRCVKYENVQRVLSYVSVTLVLLGLECRSSSAGLFWSYLVLVGVINQPTTLTRAFESSEFLKRLGKITLSFYLLGFLFISLVRTLLARTPLIDVFTVMDVRLGALVVLLDYSTSLLSARYVEANLARLAAFLCRRIENFQPLLKSHQSSSSNNSLI